MLSKKTKLIALGSSLVLAPVLMLTPAVADINTTIRQALNYGSVANGKTPVLVTGADLSKCQAGQTDAKTVTAILATLNTARELNGLQTISEISSLSEYAQASSLYLARNNTVTHELNSKNPCFTAKGESAAKHAVLSMSSKEFSAAELTNILLSDDRDTARLGHRLQLLNPKLAKTGLGVGLSDNKDAYLSVLTLNGYKLEPKIATEAQMTNEAAVTPELIAWPAQGNFPYSLMPISKTDGKNTWSASLKGKFTGAVKVTVTGPKGVVPVTEVEIISDAQNANLPGYTTVAFTLPKDLAKPAEVDTYQVQLAVGTKTVNYQVKLATAEPKVAAPVIVEQPKLASVTAGNSNKIQIVAAGKGLQYRWQVSADGGKDWSDLLDNKGQALAGPAQELVFTEAAHGSLLRVIVMNAEGGTITSDSVKVVVASVVEKEKAKPKEIAAKQDKAEPNKTEKEVAKEQKPATPGAEKEATTKEVAKEEAAKEAAEALAKEEATKDAAKAKELAAAKPVASLNVREVTSGGWLVIKASGFASGEQVAGEFHSKVIKFGAKPASSTGELTWRVSTKGLVPGSHHVVLRGLESGKTVEIPIRVKEALPEAGTNISLPLVALALGIVLLGLVVLLVVFIRRRRENQDEE